LLHLLDKVPGPQGPTGRALSRETVLPDRLAWASSGSAAGPPSAHAPEIAHQRQPARRRGGAGVEGVAAAAISGALPVTTAERELEAVARCRYSGANSSRSAAAASGSPVRSSAPM
jgi:hypothetical protein